MQDRELVAAIVAGDPDGLAEAYDRYAAPLYAYCRSMLPGPDAPDEAASAVTDTFVIATVKLPGLSDPDQVGSWLHAVARNECLGRPGALDRPVPAGTAPAAAGLAGAGLSDAAPAGLREQVLAACGDNTPAGRANRVSVAHRAGPLGRTGFPKPATAAGPRWWRKVRRRPQLAAGAAATAVVAAGVVALALVGSTHRATATTVALGGGGFGTVSAASGPPGARSSPGPKPTPAVAALRAPASGSDRPAGRASSPGTSRPVPRSASSSPGGSPSASPSPSSSPPSGTLEVTPVKLALSALKDQAVSGTFLITAVGGPADFSISSASAKVTASPKSGSLGAAGSWETVTVTAKSLVALRTTLTVSPGHLVITVVLSIKA
jgi:hypothetical protein